MRIEHSRILITGASSGIGKSLAFELARRGARLILTARNHDRLHHVEDEINRRFTNTTAHAIACDVSHTAGTRHLAQACIDRWCGLDILINNAGIGLYGETEKTTTDDLRSVFETNVLGAMNTMSATLPLLRESGKGMIVNISSVAALYGIPYLGAYGASKAALAAISQSLRAELARDDISVLVAYLDYTESGIFTAEKKTGGAHRPPGPYTPADQVACSVIRAIELEKRKMVNSFRGRTLTLARDIAPRFVYRSMFNLSEALRA